MKYLVNKFSLNHPAFTFALASLQAMALYFIYIAVEHKTAFALKVNWVNANAAFAIAFPLILLFIRRNTASIQVLAISFTAAAVIALCGYYAGTQSMPADKLSYGSITFVLVNCSLIVAFKVIIYAQLFLCGKKINFANLYTESWRTFVVGIESWIFTWILIGILFLGANLFRIIGINFFLDYLQEPYVNIPIFTISFAFALNYFQQSEQFADTVAKIIQVVIKFLLPVVAIILIGFACSIVFTGVGTLWEGGPGSVLILWLQALALFFVNSVYMGTEKEPPYSLLLHKLVLVGIAFLPVYSFLASYGLWLRIDQYGLTPFRGLGMLVNILISVFSFTYFVAIVKQHSKWFLIKNKINVYIGMGVALVCILLNTPILSMQYWSTKSQISRLDTSVSISDEDLRFFKRSLGRSGYIYLDSLKESMQAIDISYQKRFERAYQNYSFNPRDHDAPTQWITKDDYLTYPSGLTIPESIVSKVFEDDPQIINALFLQVDLDNNGEMEFVSIIKKNFSTITKVWFRTNNSWEHVHARTDKVYRNVDFEQFLIEPTKFEITTKQATLNYIQIGESIIYLQPNFELNKLEVDGND